MNTIVTDIIPVLPKYYTLPGDAQIDYKAICCFAATGFFLDNETYFTTQKAFRPASIYQLDLQGNVLSEEQHFQWHYSPRDITFNQALSEFSDLLEWIVKRGTEDKEIILPISGGLDSRTLAAALQDVKKNVYSYSYSFQNGIDENVYGAAVSRACNFPFDGFVIPEGYLWTIIEDVAAINGCFADFTTPRQMAVTEKLKDKGNTFLLGHWGDVLFDSMGVSANASFDVQVEVIKKKIVKAGGMELAQELWQIWSLPGSFENYLTARISKLLDAIPIQHANARIRAFKSLHWATRWTSSNLALFNATHDIYVPYFRDEMCKFICTVPEDYLQARRIQIEYLKKRAPKLAAIPWQKFHPCNLFNFQQYYSLKFIPYRAIRKIKNDIKKVARQKMISSNWELQFLGARNDAKLKERLFGNPEFNAIVPANLVDKFYCKFRNNAPRYHHTISIMLTMSLFFKSYRGKPGLVP